MTRAEDPTIRTCEPGDVPAITAIYGQAVLHGTATFELDPPDEAEMAARRSALLEGGFPYLVAELGGRAVGYAYAGVYRTRPAYRSTVENSVYVDESARGQGIGALLLRRLVTEAVARDFRQMVAVIGDSQNQASVALHASLGFQHVGVLRAVGWKHGRWLDTVYMQLALGPGEHAPSTRPAPGEGGQHG